MNMSIYSKFNFKNFFTPQKPIKRVSCQYLSVINKWRNKNYLKIKRKIYKRKAEICLLDKTKISSSTNKGEKLIFKENAK